MEQFKGVKKRYVLVSYLIGLAVVMMVAGLTMYMTDFKAEKSGLIGGIGGVLLALCVPLALVLFLVYAIQDRIGTQKLITRAETVKWENRKIDVVVEKDREKPDLHDTFVYVDNELVARTNARQDGEKWEVQGGFVHGARKLPIKVTYKQGDYNIEGVLPDLAHGGTTELRDYFVPYGTSYPPPTVYFEVNIDGKIITAGDPGMTPQKKAYWAFVSVLIAFLMLVCAYVPYASSGHVRFNFLHGIIILLIAAVLLLSAAARSKLFK